MTSPAAGESARVNPVRARLRAYGSSTRIVGVDVARGLAMLGMFGAHVGVTETLELADPATWLAIVHGRSSILFAVLAGVSIAIISGRTVPVSGPQLVQARVRIFTRAALIFALGGVLELLGTGVAVILPTYALLFVLAIPFLRWPPRRLFLFAGVLAIVSPVLVTVLTSLLPSGEPFIVDLLITGVYPGLTWVVFVLVGLGAGRLDLRAARIRMTLLATGGALMVAGYGAGAVASSLVPETAVLGGGIVPIIDVGVLASLDAHSGSSFEVIGSTGFALAVIALCLLAADLLRWPLFPLAAVGSMALTAYSVHLFAIALLGDLFWQLDGDALYLCFVLTALAACSAWFILLGAGPFERVLSTISRRAAGSLDGDHPHEAKAQ